MKKYFAPLFLLCVNFTFAQKISGYVTNQLHEKLSFSSIIIKGTTIGVSANAEGFFSIDLRAGNYTLICQHVGYESVEKQIFVEKSDAEINFVLPYLQYNLANVTVKTGGEDPAYQIIRNAIKQRLSHANELKEFQAEVYIKGQFSLRNYPKKFLGRKLNFEDADTSKNKIVFLSETVARYSVQQPDNAKVEVLSTRVSGNSNAFGLSYPQIISFYNNNIEVGKNLNPRGFISPIADNALNFYKYKFEGSFFDNGIMINRIKVIPKRNYEPLFSGTINIIEDSWRIYSVELTLLKEQQLQYLDTLKIEQQYVPSNNVWIIKQQIISAAIKQFGFDAYGNFVQVYNKFNVHPDFSKNFFGNVLITFPDSSNKKQNTYWDSIRPIPLQLNEIADYRKKDSLEILRQSAHYLDSLDRKRNKPTFIGMVITGQTYYKQKQKLSYTFDPVINIVNYNTVEGWNLDFSPSIYKTWKGREALYLSPNLRYGFNNQHFNAHLTGSYSYGKKYLNSIYFSGGKRVFQFNNEQPISEQSNSIGSLFFKRNYMKIYEASFGKLAYTKGLNDGLTITVAAEYQDRFPLENTTDYKIVDVKTRSFTPNYPVELTDKNMPHNQALSAGINISWQPDAKYIQLRDRKINIGSKYPTFNFSLTDGIHNVLNSNVDYTKWWLSINDDIDFKLAGRFSYRIKFGGFLKADSVFIPDYQHFLGNRTLSASEYLNSFQLMQYYQFSTAAPFFTEAHAEYHLNGLFTNKIPVIKKLNWFLVLGGNGLYINKNQQYYEVFFSIENILKIGRLDFVQAIVPNGSNTSGIRFSVLGLLSKGKQD